MSKLSDKAVAAQELLQLVQANPQVCAYASLFKGMRIFKNWRKEEEIKTHAFPNYYLFSKKGFTPIDPVKELKLKDIDFVNNFREAQGSFEKLKWVMKNKNKNKYTCRFLFFWIVLCQISFHKVLRVSEVSGSRGALWPLSLPQLAWAQGLMFWKKKKKNKKNNLIQW